MLPLQLFKAHSLNRIHYMSKDMGFLRKFGKGGEEMK